MFPRFTLTSEDDNSKKFLSVFILCTDDGSRNGSETSEIYNRFVMKCLSRDHKKWTCQIESRKMALFVLILCFNTYQGLANIG